MDEFRIYNDFDEIDFDELSDDNQDPIEEHFESLLFLPYAHLWLGHRNDVVDLRWITRHKPMYAYRIMNWMITNHTPNTPYMDTDQFSYLKTRMGTYDKKIEVVREMFKKLREKRERQ